jgi:hypothetical protein
VSGALLGRLQSLRNDVLKGETWLLGGSGRIRAAGSLEVA